GDQDGRGVVAVGSSLQALAEERNVSVAIAGQEAAGLGVEDQPFHVNDCNLVATETALGITNDRFFDRTVGIAWTDGDAVEAAGKRNDGQEEEYPHRARSPKAAEGREPYAQSPEPSRSANRHRSGIFDRARRIAGIAASMAKPVGTATEAATCRQEPKGSERPEQARTHGNLSCLSRRARPIKRSLRLAKSMSVV